MPPPPLRPLPAEATELMIEKEIYCQPIPTANGDKYSSFHPGETQVTAGRLL